MDIIYMIKREGFRRRLSVRTIKAYCFCVNKFLFWAKKEPRKITKGDVREYITHLAEKEKAGNTLNVYLCAISFMVEEVLFKRWKLNIKYSKVPKELPCFLLKEEVSRLIEVISNPKHKLIVELMYSAGLRVSELVRLKVKDMEFSRNYGWVRHGKGDKDRPFIIAERLNDRLQKHIDENNLLYDSYIFSGRNGHYHQRTIQEIVKKAKSKAAIWKNVHPHTLRHSFATHLIENGCDIVSAQSLLGHVNSETTMQYVHMAPIKMIAAKSPLDSL